MIKLLFSLSVLCVAATGKKDIGLRIYLSRERKKWKNLFKRKEISHRHWEREGCGTRELFMRVEI